jgi:hypothetical protein
VWSYSPPLHHLVCLLGLGDRVRLFETHALAWPYRVPSLRSSEMLARPEVHPGVFYAIASPRSLRTTPRPLQATQGRRPLPFRDRQGIEPRSQTPARRLTEATRHLGPDEREMVKGPIEAVLLKHEARRWAAVS